MTIRICNSCGKILHPLDGYGDPPICSDCYIYYTEDKENCGMPCDPNDACEECEAYWQRMIDEGFWDEEKHCWTDAGMEEMFRP